MCVLPLFDSVTDTMLGIVVPGSVVGPVGSGGVVAPTVQLWSVT